MVGYSQDFSRFQRAVESLEIVLRVAVREPIVNVAKGQNHIGRARRRDCGFGGRLERRYDDVAIQRGIGLELVIECLRAASASDGLVKLAVILEKRRKISVYHPCPGEISTTVMLGLIPKKVSVSSGWRYLSRALFSAERCGPSIAALRPGIAAASFAAAVVDIIGENATIERVSRANSGNLIRCFTRIDLLWLWRNAIACMMLSALEALILFRARVAGESEGFIASTQKNRQMAAERGRRGALHISLLSVRIPVPAFNNQARVAEFSIPMFRFPRPYSAPFWPRRRS